MYPSCNGVPSGVKAWLGDLHVDMRYKNHKAASQKTFTLNMVPHGVPELDLVLPMPRVSHYPLITVLNLSKSQHKSLKFSCIEHTHTFFQVFSLFKQLQLVPLYYDFQRIASKIVEIEHEKSCKLSECRCTYWAQCSRCRANVQICHELDCIQRGLWYECWCPIDEDKLNEQSEQMGKDYLELTD